MLRYAQHDNFFYTLCFRATLIAIIAYVQKIKMRAVVITARAVYRPTAQLSFCCNLQILAAALPKFFNIYAVYASKFWQHSLKI